MCKFNLKCRNYSLDLPSGHQRRNTVFQRNVMLFAPSKSAQRECNHLLYLAHTFHASCDHDAGVSRQYGLSSQAHRFQARPADHLAAPGRHRVRDSRSNTRLPDGVLASTCRNRQHFTFVLKEQMSAFWFFTTSTLISPKFRARSYFQLVEKFPAVICKQELSYLSHLYCWSMKYLQDEGLATDSFLSATLLLMAGQMKHQLQISTSLLYACKMRAHLDGSWLKGFLFTSPVQHEPTTFPKRSYGNQKHNYARTVPKASILCCNPNGKNRSAIFKESILHLWLRRPK